MIRKITDQEAKNKLATFEKILNPNGFSINAQSELCEIKREKNLQTGKIKTKLVPMAHFVPYITSQTRVIDGDQSTMVYDIAAIAMNSSTGNFVQLNDLRVAAAEFEDMKWTAQWGADATILPGYGFRDKIRYCVQILGQTAARDEVVAQIGWHNGNFLHADGVIGPDSLSVEAPRSVAKYSLPPSVKNPKAAIAASLATLEVASHHITYPLLALVFLAPLMRFFEEQANVTAKFVLWICGVTGLQKSTIVSLFLCHFGKFSDAIAPANFDSTANGLERILYDAKDVVTLVDDYYPSAAGGEGERMIKVAQKLLRAIGDRRGKPRMQSNLKQAPSFPPRGQVVVTAEDLPPSGTSTFARFLCVNVEKDDRDLEKLSAAMEKANKLRYSMRAYVEYLIENESKIENTDLVKQFQDLRTQYANERNHNRIAENLAWLEIGFASFLNFALHHQAIDQETADAMLSEAKAQFVRLGNQQQALISGTNPVDQFLDAISSMLRAKTIRLYPRKPDSIGHPFSHNPAEQRAIDELGKEWAAHEKNVGFFDEANYYFIPDAIYGAYVRQSQEIGVKTVLTKTVLFKRLKEAGKIITESTMVDSPHTCPHVTIRGNKRRYLIIPNRFLSEQQDAAGVTAEELEQLQLLDEQGELRKTNLVQIKKRGTNFPNKLAK